MQSAQINKLMVSVIIVNYNTYNLTCRCIQSIYDKTNNIEYEIILVDNNSTECPAKLFKEKYPAIKLIESPKNVGFAKGNNLGIAAATGKYILLLNSDTELLNNAVALGVDILKSDNTIGCLSGKLVYPDGTPQGVAARFPYLSHVICELFRINKLYSKDKLSHKLLGDRWDYSKAVDADWIWGAYFLFPADVLKKFPEHRLHEDFFMYYEDVLWCYYIKNKLKLRVVYSPEPLILHHLGGSGSTKNQEENYVKKILPNEVKFLKEQKGWLYSLTYYMMIAMHQITLRKKENLKKASFYAKMLLHSFKSSVA